jgi:hypothetical protein
VSVVAEETTRAVPTYFDAELSVIVVGTPATFHWHTSMAVTVDSTDAAFALPTDNDRAITGKARAMSPAPIFFWFTISPNFKGIDLSVLQVRNKSS